MKKTLKNLGIKVQELAIIFRLPATTIYSWFERYTNVPRPYQLYLNAINIIEDKITAATLEQMQNTQMTEEIANSENFKKWAFQRKVLENYVSQYTLKLHKLRTQQTTALKKQYLLQQIPEYFPPNYEHLPGALNYMEYLQQQTHIEAGKLGSKILKLEQKLAGVQAQLAYMDQQQLGLEPPESDG